MDDHLKRISEKQQVEADKKYFGEADSPVVETFSQTKKDYYEERKNDYEDKYRRRFL